MFLTCCSWRISSLRSSTRLWSSRLSWESRSVPSSAFRDSLVDSMACRLASRLWRLRCWGKSGGGEDPSDSNFRRVVLTLTTSSYKGCHYGTGLTSWSDYLGHESFLRLLPFLLQHLHLGENTVSWCLELPLLSFNLLHLVHQLVNFIVDTWRQALRKYEANSGWTLSYINVEMKRHFLKDHRDL